MLKLEPFPTKRTNFHCDFGGTPKRKAIPITHLLVVLVLLDVEGGEIKEPELTRLVETPQAVWYG